MEDQTQIYLDVAADVGHGVAVAAVVEDVHADPDVQAAEDALLVLLVLPRVVQEDPMQELLRV